MSTFPQNNRTWQILHAAAAGGYAVGAYNCYNDDGVIAVIRAAEKMRSPAIIQVFPWTLHFQGPAFVRFVVDAAHAARVPVAVHLDHCIQPADVELALTLPFDSIMVDASIHDPVENARQCAAIVRRANALGIAIEAEMGRIEGGEDGLPTVDLETIMTRPDQARDFVRGTGVQFLAPSFGNIHGSYGAKGPRAYWDVSLLKQVHEAVPDVPLVLHGTSEVSDELFHTAMDCGVVKINVNRNVRDDYSAFVARHYGSLELTTLKMRATDIYTESICRFMRDTVRSAGRA